MIMRQVVKTKVEMGYFWDMKHGLKRYLVMEDGRDIGPGDILIIQECIDGTPTDRALKRVVRFTQRSYQCDGLMPGYVIVGL